MAPHSSTLAWKIPRSLVGCHPWGCQSRTRLSDFTFTFYFPALEKEMATHSSVLAWRIPGTGEPSESDMTEVTQQQQQQLIILPLCKIMTPWIYHKLLEIICPVVLFFAGLLWCIYNLYLYRFQIQQRVSPSLLRKSTMWQTFSQPQSLSTIIMKKVGGQQPCFKTTGSYICIQDSLNYLIFKNHPWSSISGFTLHIVFFIPLYIYIYNIYI